MLTKTQAVEAIRDQARSLVTVAHAEEIAAAFGTSLAALKIEPRTLAARAATDRVTLAADHDPTEEVVGIEGLSIAIARSLGCYTHDSNPWHSPYAGRGRSAEYRSLRAADKIAAAVGLR